MLKKLLISFLFFTAYTVLLAHSIIPHHHHEEETAVEHHDKDHGADSGLDNLFSHFQHVGINNQFVSTHQSSSIKKINTPQLDIVFIISYNFFSHKGQSVPILSSDYPDIYSSSGSAAFCLRGPPSITV